METKKDILNFCNDAVFYDYKNKGIICDLNDVRNCLIDIFHKTIPNSRILITLSIIDDIILKIHDKKIENINEDIHNLRGNIIYMLSFEKTVRYDKEIDNE